MLSFLSFFQDSDPATDTQAEGSALAEAPSLDEIDMTDVGEVADAANKYLEAGQELLVAHGPRVLAALAIFLIGRMVVKMITGALRRVLNARKVDPTLTGFLSSIIHMGLLTMVVIAALGKLGVNTTSFTAIIAAAGLAIGFALQGSLGNFASGVMIILLKPFKAGDFVEIAGTAGVIMQVEVFATTLKTGDNKKIIIPNGSITGANIVNYSAHATRRIDFVWGIGYDDDIKKAKELFMKIVTEDERVLKDPAPVVAVSELADSSVNFVVRPWVNSGDYWAVYWDLTEKVKLECDANGISIPYPQRDVHVHEVKA